MGVRSSSFVQVVKTTNIIIAQKPTVKTHLQSCASFLPSYIIDLNIFIKEKHVNYNSKN